MMRARAVVLLALAPAGALAQTAASRDAAPLAPLWIAVSLVIVLALLALLVGGTRWEARAGGGRGSRREGPPPPAGPARAALSGRAPRRAPHRARA